jgi:hypothetical protein
MKINLLKKGSYSKEHIQTILKSWVIEDDAGDYFEYWMEKMELTKETMQHFNNIEIIEKIELNMNNFLDLNYNILSELQELKELLYSKTLCKITFKEIKASIKNYSYLNNLINKIDEYDYINDNKKTILLFCIFKNLLYNVVKLSESIFNPNIFSKISYINWAEITKNDSYLERPSKMQKKEYDTCISTRNVKLSQIENTQLFRSWRKQYQLDNIKKQSLFENIPGIILKTDNFLSTSRNKEFALKFYRDASISYKNDNNKYFTMWQIDIPYGNYPYLHVDKELDEILLHIASILQYNGYTYETYTLNDKKFKYKLEKYTYMGFDEYKYKNSLSKYYKILKNATSNCNVDKIEYYNA